MLQRDGLLQTQPPSTMWLWPVMPLASSEAGDLVWHQVVFEGLVGEDFGGVFGGEDEFALLFGHDGAGKDGVDADVVLAELVGEGAGEADDGGLGGDIDGHAGIGDEPGDGAEVEDGGDAGLLQCGKRGLGEEELMAKVDGHQGIPELRCDFGGGVATVVAGVVDEDVETAEGIDGGCNGWADGGDVGDVATKIDGRGKSVCLDGCDQPGGGLVLNIEEGDLGALLSEAKDEGFADAGCSSRNEDAAALKAGIARESGGGRGQNILPFCMPWLARALGAKWTMTARAVSREA